MTPFGKKKEPHRGAHAAHARVEAPRESSAKAAPAQRPATARLSQQPTAPASPTPRRGASPTPRGYTPQPASSQQPGNGANAAPARNAHAAYRSYEQQAQPARYGAGGTVGHGPQGTGRFPPSKPKKKKAWRIVFIVSLVVLIGSLVALGAIAYQYISQRDAYSQLEQHVSVSESENLALSDLTVDWDSLRAVNPDIVAWVYMPGTPINYPMVQGSDNEEYLHKAFDSTEGWLASAGTIFVDAANSSNMQDQNIALYGHHMNDGSMFASIADMVDQAQFDAHRDIYVLTPSGNYCLRTFAIVQTMGDDAIVQTTFATRDDYVNYIQDKLDRSVVSQSENALSAADVKQSFLLSTCEYSQNDGRAVLFASVVETTIGSNQYVVATEKGSTGITASESAPR